ncbi:MAG: tRNA1(Val) (adenine(37)-N6)-methyltransferase [Chitinophagales bacterium]
MSLFHFKQFTIQQEKTAMKVGTDGVLLGAWVKCSTAKKILDIGAGTGLISLMLAQQNPNAKITAIELETNASLECKSNFTASKWKENLELIQGDIKDFNSLDVFDFIVSNPPFFNASFKNENKNKTIARHTESLSFEVLLKKTSELLTKNGSANFVIPFSEKKHFIALAKSENLFPKRITYVKGNETAPVKRILLEFTKTKQHLQENTLVIEISRHNYTKEYIDLTKEFYLNM